MGCGTASSGCVGLFYEEDPSYKNRIAPYIVKYCNRYQVCIPEGKLVQIVAEFMNESDAIILLNRYKLLELSEEYVHV